MTATHSRNHFSVNVNHDVDSSSIIKNKNGLSNKTIIRFGFCDIRNNQGRGKCYQPKPKAEADNTYRDLHYSGYHKNFIQ